MNDEDRMQIVILEDGTIKTTTDPIGVANHSRADAFLNLMARLAGGESTRSRREDTARREHAHAHEHEHLHAGRDRKA